METKRRPWVSFREEFPLNFGKATAIRRKTVQRHRLGDRMTAISAVLHRMQQHQGTLDMHLIVAGHSIMLVLFREKVGTTVPNRSLSDVVKTFS
jgi:hypothetical protein